MLVSTVSRPEFPACNPSQKLRKSATRAEQARRTGWMENLDLTQCISKSKEGKLNSQFGCP